MWARSCQRVALAKNPCPHYLTVQNERMCKFRQRAALAKNPHTNHRAWTTYAAHRQRVALTRYAAQIYHNVLSARIIIIINLLNTAKEKKKRKKTEVDVYQIIEKPIKENKLINIPGWSHFWSLIKLQNSHQIHLIDANYTVHLSLISIIIKTLISRYLNERLIGANAKTELTPAYQPSLALTFCFCRTVGTIRSTVISDIYLKSCWVGTVDSLRESIRFLWYLISKHWSN